MQIMQLHQELALQLSYDEELVAEIEARRRKTFSSSWHQIMLDFKKKYGLARCNIISKVGSLQPASTALMTESYFFIIGSLKSGM